MTGNSRLIARIALFSALIYVLSLGTAVLPNVNLIFFIVFSAGFMWGLGPGILVGALGMGLWTSFNPYGPAPLPIAIAQIVGAALCGVIGYTFRRIINLNKFDWSTASFLISAAVLCTAFFYIPVSLIDAWLFQPFRQRFFAGLLFSITGLVSNIIIFPLLFRLLRPFYVRECNLK